MNDPFPKKIADLADINGTNIYVDNGTRILDECFVDLGADDGLPAMSRRNLSEMVRRYNLHDDLIDALKKAALRNPEDVPCFCVVPIPADTAHHLSCQSIRAILKKARGES